MESQPQNPEFRNNPENFHPCIESLFCYAVLSCFLSSFALISLGKREPVALL